MKKNPNTPRRRAGHAAAAVLLALAALVPTAFAVPAVAAVESGDDVWIGPREGYSGTGIFPIHAEIPGDPSAPGETDLWAYCIEHDVSARTRVVGVAGDPASYLGSNNFLSPAIQARVHWTLTHSYPAVDLDDLAVAAGITGLSRNDAIEATQYAIWNFTDLWSDPGTAWNWETPNSEAVYRYLVTGALAGAGATPPATQPVTVSVSAPAAATAGTLAGPFTVTTDQPSARVSTASGYPITDAAGAPIDVDAVVDGQQLYLDLRAIASAGSASITATVDGSSSTGLIVSVPAAGGGAPTSASHAQTIALVAAADATTSASADVTWVAAAVPAIGTHLVDALDDDQVLAWDGGTLIDRVSYTGLTPGTTYTIAGELMRRSDAAATGIEGSTTFTPVAPDGTVEVSFTVPEGYAGESLVAFESLFLGATAAGVPLVVHADIDDAAQTVAVAPAPAIGTTATTDNPADDKVLALTGGTITDTVSFTGFEPNGCAGGSCATEYEIRGELMLVDGGTATPTGIVSAPTVFTTEVPDGTVTVAFELSAAQAERYAGRTLVVFESVYERTLTTEVPVVTEYAAHHDPADAAQSVRVASRPVVAVAPSDGGGLAITGGALPLGLASGAAMLALAGTMLFMTRRRARS